ncbi:MAG: hypothetical protein K0Q68_3112 [Moraxellaceae bacterium]|jgi:hypothetical protein|nr:hypothetical protein [Moraxellaceae bacterium]
MRFLLLALLLCSSSLARAQGNYTEATRFIFQLYNICVQTMGDPVAINKVFTEQNVPRLTAEEARPFLGGGEGNAWPSDMPFGKYVFTSRSDGLCAVHALWADAPEVEQAFVELLENFRRQAGGHLVKAADEVTEKGRHILSFNFGPPTPEGFYLNMSVSTHSNPRSELQALLAYAVIKGDLPESSQPKSESSPKKKSGNPPAKKKK